MRHVTTIKGVNYERIGDEGLLLSHGETSENLSWLAVDIIVLRTGQEPLRELLTPSQAANVVTYLSAVPTWQPNSAPSARSTRPTGWPQHSEHRLSLRTWRR